MHHRPLGPSGACAEFAGREPREYNRIAIPIVEAICAAHMATGVDQPLGIRLYRICSSTPALDWFLLTKRPQISATCECGGTRVRLSYRLYPTSLFTGEDGKLWNRRKQVIRRAPACGIAVSMTAHGFLAQRLIRAPTRIIGAGKTETDRSVTRVG